MGRLSRLAAALAVVLAPLALPATTAAAEVQFGTPTATSDFGVSVTFEQPVTVRDVAATEILVTFPSSLGPLATPMTRPPDGTSTLTHAILVSDGHLYPNTRITARWRLTFEDGSTETGPEVSVTYDDDRFEWQTAVGDPLVVHWYEGGAAFGERALRIGEAAIAESEALLGVEETEPIDLFVYADRVAFYDAIGPGARENVGGTALPDLRTMYALITPGQIGDSWVGVVIPHELSHVVFDTAVSNPYNYPPHWLDEGVAMYLSQGYDASERQSVEQAVRDGTLIPLHGLTGQFPTTRDGFFLAYSQSVSAVDFMVRSYGREALVGLIDSYAEGRTDDEAFLDALGVDPDGFNAAWFASLGATVPDQVGPMPDPAGPLPSAWAGAVVSPSPGTSGDPGATAAPTPTPGPDGGDDGGLPVIPMVVGAFAILAVVLVIGVLAMRRSRPSAATALVEPASPAAPVELPRATPGDNEASHGPDA